LIGKTDIVKQKIRDTDCLELREGGSDFTEGVVCVAGFRSPGRSISPEMISTRREGLHEVCKKIARYETNIARAVIERVLWKARVDEAGGEVADPEAYRVKVPGPARESLRSFFHSDIQRTLSTIE